MHPLVLSRHHPVHIHLIDFFIVRRDGADGVRSYEELTPKVCRAVHTLKTFFSCCWRYSLMCIFFLHDAAGCHVPRQWRHAIRHCEVWSPPWRLHGKTHLEQYRWLSTQIVYLPTNPVVTHHLYKPIINPLFFFRSPQFHCHNLRHEDNGAFIV